MKRIIAIAFYTVFAISLLQAQQRKMSVSKRSDTVNSEQRVALIIGNSAYKIAPLLNPINDAKDMEQALSSFGFDTIYKENLTNSDMKKAIRDFGERIRNGGVGFFYYAGHGIQVNGHNYLIPIEAVINNEYEVEYESVDIGLVLAQMEEAETRLNVVILDACRNNPFTRSFRSTKRGLASTDPLKGTLIAYATAPGAVASDGDTRNGLYTQELLNAMRIPGLKLEDVFKRVRIAVQRKTASKQIPWETSSLIEDFYFLKQEAPDAKSSVPDAPSLTHKLLFGIWAAQGDAFTETINGKPIFYEFSAGGKVKRRTLDNSYSELRDYMDWYQIGDIIHIFWYDNTSKNKVRQEYQGKIKMDRVEGLITETDTGKTRPYVLLKVLQ